jgi:hypothetical protein
MITRLLSMKKYFLLSLLIVCATTVQAQDPFWTAIEGPYSGSFWASRVMSDGTYYAGTGDGRILRKLPGDNIWRLVATTPENQTILSFNEYDGWIFAGDGNGSVLASRDNFDSWILASNGIDTRGAQIRSMLVAADGFYLGTGTGVYKYVYDAVRDTPSWEPTSFDTPRGKFVFSLADDASGKRYAGTGTGLYSSSDGETWEPAGFNITTTTIFSVAIRNNDVYVGTANGVYVHYETSPPGEWTTLARYITKESFSVRSVAVIGDRTFISVTGVGTYYSDDDAEWVKLPYIDARAGFHADNDLLMVATDDGVWTSPLDAPENNATRIGTPENITLLTSVRSKIFAAAGSRTLYMSSSPRDDENWTTVFRVYSEGTVKCYAEKSDGNRYINLTGSATGASLFGFTMFPDQNGYDAIPFPSEVRWLNQFYVTENDSVLIATNIGVYHFNTTTFEIKRLSKVTFTGIEVLSLSEDPEGNLYAATPEGFHVSADEGKTWTISKLTDSRINKVLLIGPHEGYAATDKGLYYFADLNVDPVTVDGFSSVVDIAQDGFGQLYVIDDKTIYHAADKNSEWLDVTENLRGLMPRALRAVDNYVYIATDGGLFKHQFAEYAAVSLSGLGFFTYDGTQKPAVATTDPSGLDVDVTYNKTHDVPQGPGMYKVKALVNDGVYFGEAFGKITIGGIPAQVQIVSTDFVVYDGAPHGAAAATDPSGLNVEITYNDSPVVPVNAGSYVVEAIITGENYAGYASDTIVIDKAQQVIALEDLPRDVVSSDGPFTLTATSSVGLPVTFTVEGPATIYGNVLTMTGGEGEVVITAVQDGNLNYYSANTVMHRMRVWTGTITGTESDIKNSLFVYPVPSHGNHITIEHTNGTIASIDVVDIAGKSFGAPVAFGQPVSLVNIPTAPYPAGTHVLVIETGKRERLFRRIEIIK